MLKIYDSQYGYLEIQKKDFLSLDIEKVKDFKDFFEYFKSKNKTNLQKPLIQSGKQEDLQKLHKLGLDKDLGKFQTKFEVKKLGGIEKANNLNLKVNKFLLNYKSPVLNKTKKKNYQAELLKKEVCQLKIQDVN